MTECVTFFQDLDKARAERQSEHACRDTEKLNPRLKD